MTHPSLSLGASPDLSHLLALGVPAAALALALVGWAFRRRAQNPQNRLGNAAVVVAALAALGCTAYSADTSWRFAADYLNIAGTAERASMFAAAELGLFATALMARQNLNTQGAPGLPGTLVWLITGVQVIPAYAESGPVGGTVRAFVGPVMAAMLWHLAMGIELRLRTPGAASHGLIATLGREARERLLSRLGIAARDRDAAQITRDRATARAVALATRLAELTAEQRQSRRGRRLTRRLSIAIGRASVGTDPAQRAELLAQLAARRHALALATVPLPSPWSPPRSGEMATTVRAASTESISANDGPHIVVTRNGDRGLQPQRGPDSENAKRHDGTEDREAGTEDRSSSSHGTHEPGTKAVNPEPGEEYESRSGTGLPVDEVPAQRPEWHRGPGTDESGTDTTGDRGPNDTGTDTTGDRGHQVPLRRTPAPKAKGKGKRSGRSRGPQAQRPAREREQDIDQLVELIRPHVPALLERDGNAAVTRVQLREIIRREKLPGGRNDRLSLVLAALRSPDSNTTTRSTTR
ncbi:membrane protein [Streptomyces thermocarboxydovorans]|uniref:Membrane protein n=1 Tax=Streptomyces thermocarboxydovorans TaxID=59298 RepID=A0ABN1HXM1_9ACTN